ncbi:sigma-54 dependent transcriptional regulator [Bdellovibrio sp. SKB1291214]|uniref:sigma-54 interaction domain-containing protein n=1 Tax=Bdellovibrio sp. SKB1291214 TaxID=1732569 RepID=UPI000B518E6A|nr:sigma-54 dependent transcriptional regulator [Bdellovibrio sp. SKB1291214]UYL08879.1 sigma-54 dependent transcriptional regulator [Bdellovibrio sp. SKB1291214]
MKEGRDIIAESPAFLSALAMARKVAESCSNVLITGESGTGKEVVAKFIHEQSPRNSRGFIALNCAAIPDHLLESELFGYARGAFTGATTNKIGLFEEAEGGTLFLDEIADLELNLQAKILRVLQERKIKRLGENTLRPINIRVIAATHENLHRAVQTKKFREDLFFRLNVISINVPSLRDRREDILPLANHFVQKFSITNEKKILGFTPAANEFLMQQQWPGNVRELENRIERAVVLSMNSHIEMDDLHPQVGALTLQKQNTLNFINGKVDESSKILSMEEMTQLYIEYALSLNKGAKEKTARDLGIDRKTLYRKLGKRHPTL